MTRRVGGILQTRQDDGASKPFTIDRDQAENAWTWVRRRIGLEGDTEFVMHALRHTTATRLIDRGIDLYTVKEWLGQPRAAASVRPQLLIPSGEP